MNRRTRWARTAVAGLLLAAVMGPVAWVLLQRVPNRVDRPLANDGAGDPSVTVELAAVTGTTVTRAHTLWRSGRGDLAPAESVSLLVETYGTSPTLDAAQLRIGTCVFALPAPVVPAGGTLVTLMRNAPCADWASTAELHVRVSGTGKLGLWTWYQPVGASPDHEGLTLTSPAGASPVNAVIRGRYGWTVETRGPTRAALLAWMWNIGHRGAVVAAVVLVAVFGAGIILLVSGGRWREPVGVGLCALGLAAAWAIVVPPLQGADEPDHLLSFGEVAGLPGIPAQLETLARVTHFERLRFRSLEKFTPADVNSPYPIAWTGDVHSERMDQRSPLTMHLWRIAAALGAGDVALPHTILAIRLFNALVFAVAVGVAAALVRATSGSATAWGLCGLLLIPTVAYFAVMVSDWAFVVAGAVLLCGAVVSLILDGPRTGAAGVVLGAGLAILVSTSMASLALAPLVVMILAARMLLGSRAPASPREAWMFWLGFGVTLMLGYLIARDVFLAGYARYDAESGSKAAFMAQINSVVGWLARSPWVLLLALPLCALAELRLGPRLRATALARPLGIVAVILTAIGALALLVTIPASMNWPMPVVALLDGGAYASVRDYSLAVVLAVASLGRLSPLDHLTFTSLWSGFGWIDTILPVSVLTAMAVATALVAATSVGADTPGRPRRHMWRLAIWIGAGVSVAAVAVATFMMGRNVHGRYLLGIMLPLVAASAAGLFEWVAARPFVVRALSGVVLAALHGYSLAFVLMRYF